MGIIIGPPDQDGGFEQLIQGLFGPLATQLGTQSLHAHFIITRVFYLTNLKSTLHLP